MSMRRASFGDMYGATSKSFTSPAIWLARRAGSKRVMRVMPDLPGEGVFPGFSDGVSDRADDAQPGDDDSAATALSVAYALGVRLDVVDGLLHGGDLLRLLVRDLGLELLLERHHQLDRVERVGAQVVDERRLVLDLGLVHAELLGDDLS